MSHKKAKSKRGSKTMAMEEVAESAHDDFDGTRPIAEAGQSESSVACSDVDLMISAVPVEATSSQPLHPGVQLMPCVLSDDSSKSKGAVVEAAATSASASEEAASEPGGHSAKVPQPEEMEVESEG